MKYLNGVFLFTFAFTLYMLPVGTGRLSADAEAAEFDGVIEPHLVVEVGAEVPGIIDAVNVDRGDMVTTGQVLAELHSGVEKASLELARARAQMEGNIKSKEAALEFAKRNSQRNSDLYEAKALAEQKYDEIETQKILAEAELAEASDQKRLNELEYEQAAEVLKRKTILSPVAGVVMERYLSRGEYIEDKPIFKIAQVDPLNVEVVLPVSEYGSVKVGMHGLVKPESPVGGEYEATVTIVDKVVDAASGTFGVRLEIPNPDFQIPPGLKCKVVFHTGE